MGSRNSIVRSGMAWCGLSLCVAPWCMAPLARGQVVQLPTTHVFSVGTTVVVPDRGSAYLGGVNRAAYGSSTHGVPGLSKLPGAGRLFANRAIGSEVGSSRAFATATIIDHDELDREVLAAAAARRRGGETAADRAMSGKAAFLSSHVARRDPSLLTASAAGRPTAAVERDAPRRPVLDPQAEAREAFRTAQEAEARGHLATARIQYKLAALRGQGELRAAAQARYDQLSQTPGKSPGKSSGKSPVTASGGWGRSAAKPPAG